MDKANLKERFVSSSSVGLFASELNGGSSNGNNAATKVMNLASGDDVADSVNCACFVANQLKSKSDVYGFNQLGNAVVSHPPLRDNVTHYFAVVDKRYIVDLWLRHHIGEEDFVFDLNDERDKMGIIQRYGTPRLWSVLGYDGLIKPFDKDFPVEKKLRFPANDKSIEKARENIL